MDFTHRNIKYRKIIKTHDIKHVKYRSSFRRVRNKKTSNTTPKSKRYKIYGDETFSWI